MVAIDHAPEYSSGIIGHVAEDNDQLLYTHMVFHCDIPSRWRRISQRQLNKDLPYGEETNDTVP